MAFMATSPPLPRPAIAGQEWPNTAPRGPRVDPGSPQHKRRKGTVPLHSCFGDILIPLLLSRRFPDASCEVCPRVCPGLVQKWGHLMDPRVLAF